MAAHEAPITRWCVRKRGRPQRRLTVMRSSPHAVAPVLQQWWQHWPTGSMGTTLVGSRTTHGRPLHPLELKIVKKASGPATRNRERVGTPRCASLDSPSFAFSSS